MALTRQERVLHHRKAGIPISGRGVPSKDDGKNGDVAYRTLSGVGVVHYIKKNGEWQALSSTDKMPPERIRVSGGVGGGAGITNHGELGGLLEDHHALYVLADGTRAFSGNWTNASRTIADLGIVTTVDINGGTIDGAAIATSNITVGSSKTLDVSGGTLTTSAAQKEAIMEGAGANIDIGTYDLRAATITPDGLTSGRVVFAGTAGVLSSDNDLRFSTDTLTATKIGAFEAAGAIDFSDENMTNVNINTGAIDGTTIGASSATTIKGTTIDATTDFTVGTLVITDDSIVMSPSVSDTVTISAATNGVLNITTNDAAAAAGNIVVTADGTLDLNSVALDIDASGAVTIDGATTVAIAGASTSTYGDDTAVWSFNGSGAVSETGMTTFSLTPSGDIIILTGGDMFLDAQEIIIGDDNDVPIEIDATTFNLDATSGITIDGVGVSIDSSAASNLATSSGALTITSAAAATWKTSAGNLTIDSAAGTLVLDGHTGITLDASNSGNVEINVTAADDILIGNDAVAQDILLGNSAATQVDLTAILVDINGGASGVTIDGAAASNFTTSAGALTITAAAASTWSTSAGALTITAAAASTWSTSAGALTVDSVASTLTLDGHTGVTVQSTNSGNITLDSVADIALSADGGNVTMDDGTSTIFDFDVDNTILTIHDDQDTGDKVVMTVSQHGTFQIVTTDDDAAAAHIIIEADGQAALVGTLVTLNSSGDVVLSADGDQVKMDDGTTTRFTFNVDSTPELDVTGNFILDGSGTIELDSAGNLITLTSSKVHQQSPYSHSSPFTDSYLHRIDGIGQMLSIGDADYIANLSIITNHELQSDDYDANFPDGW